MPYVDNEAKERLANGGYPENAGELNFVLTCVVNEYTRRKGLRYAHINDVLGALEGAKAEFYRRVAAPYENTKIRENGDVYSTELTGETGVLACNAPIALPPVRASIVSGSVRDFKMAEQVQGALYRRNPETGAREVWVPYATPPGAGRWESVEG